MAWSPPVRSASDTEALTQMLNEFLAGASVNDAAAHDRFWAEDLVYTSSSGLRFGKVQIMEGLDDGGEPSEDQPSVVYTAENILIRQYADTAVVAFRLLGTPQQGDAKLKQYFNTGTFVRRNGEWRVVAWQATIIPETE
ncbi:MAG: nuclear transport factor 2 family protein [Xanthomonadales bacterium]|nr:nuclear transport factor 2 family protein [Xanthomonadales bacterium]